MYSEYVSTSLFTSVQDSRSHPLLPVFTKSSPSLSSLSPFKARSGFLLLISPRGKVFHKPVFCFSLSSPPCLCCVSELCTNKKNYPKQGISARSVRNSMKYWAQILSPLTRVKVSRVKVNPLNGYLRHKVSYHPSPPPATSSYSPFSYNFPAPPLSPCSWGGKWSSNSERSYLKFEVWKLVFAKRDLGVYMIDRSR